MRALIPSLFALAVLPAHAAVHDLATDWSFTENPNGVWTYLGGETPFGSTVSDWLGFGRAWTNGDTYESGLTPMLMRYDGVSGPAQQLEALAGDIVTHTRDTDASGNTDALVVRFVAPTAGVAQISGSLWDAQLNEDRDQLWQLLVDGVVQASGVVLGDGTEGRVNPDTFALSDISLQSGDAVELRVRADNDTIGGFVGMNLSVTVSPVPEPGTWMMATAGLLGLGAWRRRMAATR